MAILFHKEMLQNEFVPERPRKFEYISHDSMIWMRTRMLIPPQHMLAMRTQAWNALRKYPIVGLFWTWHSFPTADPSPLPLPLAFMQYNSAFWLRRVRPACLQHCPLATTLAFLLVTLLSWPQLLSSCLQFSLFGHERCLLSQNTARCSTTILLYCCLQFCSRLLCYLHSRLFIHWVSSHNCFVPAADTVPYPLLSSCL